MNKPGPITARPLSVLVGGAINDVFRRQGFASRELVTRWAEIAGAEIAAHAQPLKMQWPRPVEGQPQEPATLVLRVEGPMALEIQHSSDVILERVNRFFGWHAVGKLALRQGPLTRPPVKRRPAPPDPKKVAKVASTLTATDDDALRDALARLTAPGVDALESQRENAVLARLHERTSESEAAFRAGEAERIVTRHARRAIVGAMAAVAPGTDLIVQGALAASLARDLARLYGVGVSDIEVESLLREARLTLRTGTSVVLAIAGNALKAFPGLGTLGGGVLHAFAYALIFDSLGRALAATLAESHRLDGAEAARRMRELLEDGTASRLARLTELTRDAWRGSRGER
jgi:hypothetical protein